VLVMSGPGVRKGARVYNPTLLDIAPTALHLAGLPRGADMDGRVLAEAMDGPPLDPIPSWDDVEGAAGLHPPDLRQDPYEARDALTQLVELGYLAALPESQEEKIATVRRETRFNLAVTLLSTQRGREALDMLAELHETNPHEDRYTLSYIRCLFELGYFERTRELTAEFLGTHPGDPGARFTHAATFFAQGRHEEALPLLERLAADTPGSWEKSDEIDHMIGMALVLLRRPAEAQRAFSRAVTKDRSEARAHHGLALAALLRHRFEEAAGHCLDALELNEQFADAHYTLGVILAWMGDLPKAVKSFNLALTLRPGLIDAHRFLAAVHARRGDAAPASEHRQKAADLIASRERDTAASAPGAEGPDRLPPNWNAEPPMGPTEWTQDAGRAAKKPR
jgi:tetratricopeptide (TPR) repeat protein